MHELSLMANLLKKIDKIAIEQHADRVVSVKVKLGALAHISADHFRGHFVDGAKGTKAEGARLDVEVSEDMDDPNAQDILLDSIEVS
jgi:hydrogenase nickel incorporation protein HypA/HybF